MKMDKTTTWPHETGRRKEHRNEAERNFNIKVIQSTR